MVLFNSYKREKITEATEYAITGALGLSTFSHVSIIRIYYFGKKKKNPKK